MNLNVFDLRGPEFLAFYACLLAFSMVGALILRRWLETGNSRDFSRAVEWLKESPYAIAYARGGGYEAIRTAIVSLLERGFLKCNGSTLEAARQASAQVTDSLDKALVLKFALPAAGSEAMKDGIIQNEADSLAVPLTELGILENQSIRRKRWGIIFGATCLLWLMGGVKIAVALARGRYNLEFLVLLLAISPFLIYSVVCRVKTTSLGRRAIKEVQRHFKFLRAERKEFEMRNTTNEITYLAAVYGLAMLPPLMGAAVDRLHLIPPKPPPGTAGGSGCGGGSSCGGSSCGGGGGGCGGGGCGGCGS